MAAYYNHMVILKTKQNKKSQDPLYYKLSENLLKQNPSISIFEAPLVSNVQETLRTITG